ncbi:MAG: glucose-1-phosphate cytidylyltransferase [Clostridia bacterium]|jgi:glucose-1-phosphate cytidylyltransferase|nr:glucose-1-phosphate cytidylyltransferase [Clostridia bacterium]MBQ5802322.1 glucose-1-phosphate cytidylyltransferase [Clostridia bacterium]
MKAVILAGGKGTRISEESMFKPKPMITIGDKPILWHIMKSYAKYGVTEFIICGGYKQNVIKEYFNNYALYNSDVTFDFKTGEKIVHQNVSENWKVTVVDTGMETMTGGRIKRIRPFVGNEPFFLTYGDGVSDVDIGAVYEHHKNCGGYVTLTAVQPTGRFGLVTIQDDGAISTFAEKKVGDKEWINGGFFVCEKEIFDYIDGDDTIWERAPLESIAKAGKLFAYKHNGFWKPMDTLRDKMELEALWESGNAPWKA